MSFAHQFIYLFSFFFDFLRFHNGWGISVDLYVKISHTSGMIPLSFDTNIF